MRATQKADTEPEVIRQEIEASRDWNLPDPDSDVAMDGGDAGGGSGNLSVRVTIMFSATMPPAVERLAQKYMRFPAIVKIGDRDTGKNKRIKQNVFLLPSVGSKKSKLLSLVRETSPPIIVFANSKVSTNEECCVLLEVCWERIAKT